MTPPSSTTPAAPRKTVFLVDDHPLVREWLTSLVNQQHDLVVCGEAESAVQALQAIQTAQPDVAIVDLSLANSSGLELIKDLRELCPAVAILVLSMHEEQHYVERALRAGASGYIMKRETTRKVISAIRHVLQGKLYVNEELAAAMAVQFLKGRTPSAASPVERLSDRELGVFQLLGQGRGTRQIAEHLCVSLKTVQAYCARIKEKLHLASATELLREAVRHQDSLEQR